VIQAFQSQDLPGFVGGSRLDPQLSGDPDDLRHLFCITLGNLPLLQVQIVFKTHTGVAADQEGLGADGGDMVNP